MRSLRIDPLDIDLKKMIKWKKKEIDEENESDFWLMKKADEQKKIKKSHEIFISFSQIRFKDTVHDWAFDSKNP